jgi:hypothetical protein
MKILNEFNVNYLGKPETDVKRWQPSATSGCLTKFKQTKELL